jgi:hypothetical protein
MLEDAKELVHFRELHFLPRVIFSIGAILLIGAFFVREAFLGVFGIGVVFAASTLNLLINVILGVQGSIKKKALQIPWMLISQGLLAFVLASVCLYASIYYFRHGVLAPVFLPSTN